MHSKPGFHRLYFPRALAVFVLLLGVAVLAGRAGPTPVSAQTGSVSVQVQASPNPVALGQQVTISFSAVPAAVTPQPTISSIMIDFGDGQVVSTSPSNTSVPHTYSAAGGYNVVVTATDSAGNRGSGSTQVEVEQLSPPQAFLSPTTQTAQIGQPVSFSYQVSVANSVIGGTVQTPTVTITFGDGSQQQLTQASGTVPHTYTTAGTYPVLLSASFPGGQAGTASATVIVGAATPPTVSVSASPASIQPGQSTTISYTVTPSSASVGIRSVAISFGDAASPQQLSAAAGSVPHTYTTQGTFTATVTAVDSNGQSGMGSTTIVVAPPSVSGQPLTGVQIVNAPAAGIVGQPVSFTAATATTPNSGAIISSYSFSFGDNTAPTTATAGQTVTHTFTTPGTYTVTLTATDSTGVSGTSTSQIVIATAGPPVSYGAGWNLVSGPTGTIVTGNSGPLYTFQPGDTAYEVIPNGTPLKGGLGYWAFFPTAATSSIVVTTPQTITAQAPAGQFFQVGNAGNTNATVSGADAVDAFNPTTNSYVQTTTLLPGQAAWVYSAAGGTITITNAAQ